MTVVAHPQAVRDDHAEHHDGPTGLLKWMTSTDHKVIGMNYMVTSIVVFFLAGLMALAIRYQLLSPQGGISGHGLSTSSSTRCSPCTAA